MEWLHRKADENAHNEILAFLLIILGVNLLIGGLLTVIVVVGEPAWLLVFPYTPPKTPSTYLGLVPRKGRTASKSISEILEEYAGKRKRE
ncbi:MAG: hypothetical protein QMD13_00780 [Candidatus Bathyarchaeia archaeon]|nr:hypothetical protein [Candidatus Bathyarchaeia archaeon]